MAEKSAVMVQLDKDLAELKDKDPERLDINSGAFRKAQAAKTRQHLAAYMNHLARSLGESHCRSHG
jgi:hypothetical protein